MEDRKGNNRLMVNHRLEEIKPKQKTGNEPFFNNGAGTGKSLLDFWRWSQSDLISNTTRGALGEFIVSSALGIDESKVRREWAPYDLETDDGIKIEVKTAAYLQSWFQKDYSKISFSIKAARYWSSETGRYSDGKTRPSDVYVFCLFTCKDKSTMNPLEMSQWEFYALATNKIDNYKRSQSSITINSLRKLQNACDYGHLRENVRSEYLFQKSKK
jgi:hypothetical protein